MDFTKLISRPNPYDTANIVNRNFFWWINPLFIEGYRKELEVSDLYKNPKEDSSERLGGRLQNEWDKELRNGKRKPSLLRAILRAFGFWYFMAGSLSILSECVVRVIQPIAMGYLIIFFDDYQKSLTDKKEDKSFLDYFYICGASICLLGIIYVFLFHPYFFKMRRKGMQLRIACCNLVYRKALRLSRRALGRTTVGQMVNLLSNDVNRFDNSLVHIPFIVTAPIQTIITIAYLYTFLEWTVFVGCSVLIVYLPFQAFMGRLFSNLRAKTAILTDERIRLMNEIIPAMRVIKMYTWEKPFTKLVEIARRREVAKIKRTALLRGINMALFFVSSKIIIFLCFVAFILDGHTITAQIVFVSIALFNNLRTTLTLYFPYAISQGSETLITISRIQEFLLLEEKEEQSDHINKINLPNKPKDSGVWMNKMVASWHTKQQNEPTLNNLTFSVKPGELIVIVGSVGSGKSSVLMSVLSEIPVISGEVKVRGKVAYASQEPWVFAGSVLENVLFGSPFDEEKYKKVLHVCALEKDLQLFPFEDIGVGQRLYFFTDSQINSKPTDHDFRNHICLGDQTIVGDRGVSLSGGQKARVNLARALYCDADIYLLDDPLSAVDAAVSKHIFEKCIRGYLKDKVVLLVTHQLQFIKTAHQILVLKEGKAQALGSYSQLVDSGIDFIKLSGEEKPEPVTKIRSLSTRSVEKLNTVYNSSLSIASSTEVENEELSNYIEGEAPQQQRGETQTTGSVKGAIYWLYVRSGGGFLLISTLIISNVITQTLYNGSDYFLSLWTQKESLNSTTKLIDDLDRNTNILIFSALVGGLFLFSLVRTTVFFTICMKSSIILHNRLFESVIRASISFFDNNPIGVLLNRCSRDMGIIDDMLPPTAFDAIESFVQLFGVLIMISIIDYWVVIPTVSLIFIFYYLHKYYIKSARSIKRLEGITRSPLFSHLANSLYGLATVRAFGVQKSFEKKFDDYQDNHTAAWFLFISTTRWFGIVLDWLCVVYLTAVIIALSLKNDNKTASEIGLAITSAITLSGMFQWGVRQSAELESQMTSVERVNEYSHLPPENNLEVPDDKKPPKDWPNKGVIHFDDVTLQYHRDDPPVLKNLCFTINAKEKVGIVGRTGAGKSSIIAALFRMSPPSGIILIDGIDTDSIGLTDLRNKISNIPQDPVLFAGPVRRNIDPFNNHTDKRLWEVLEEVRLKEAVMDLTGGLDADISEGGSNFSVGQRQLICLARAILKQNRILVLDEATANVDPKTDSLIQQTIREKFADCTVLTIAHRLHTIMDADRVLVLDAGRVIEFDEPHLLLQNENGLFASMVQMTGKGMANNLKEMAQIAYDNRRNESPYNKLQIEALKHNLAKETQTHGILIESLDNKDE